jgi:predicted phosphodiesterase
MKLAFISDIHANLPALKAVLRHIEEQAPDDIYCLGDLVNFAGWDDEVIELIRRRNISCLQGNHDEGIGYRKKTFPFSAKTKAQQEFGRKSIKYVEDSITEENRTYLCNLPFMIRLDFRFPFQRIRLAMVHGSPNDNNEYILPATGEEYLLQLLDAADADILLMGHTHVPFHKAIYCEQEGKKLYRHIVNVGSVGKPKHGSPDSCYALLEIDRSLTLEDPGSVAVHFQYVPYDTKETLRHIHLVTESHAYDELVCFGEHT